MNKTLGIAALLGVLLVACPETPKAPTIASFAATPNEVPNGGGKTMLTWEAVGATELSITPDVGAVTGTSKEVNVTKTTTFTLTAKNVAGQDTKTVEVRVAATPAPPTIDSFAATPSTLPFGGGTTKLEWASKNATELSITPDVGVVTGTSKEVNVTKTTTFTLTAKGAGGTVSKDVQVNVADGSLLLAGKIPAWAKGQRFLSAVDYPANQSPRVLASGSIGTDGNFEVLLPSASELETLLPEITPTPCSGLTFTPTIIKGTFLADLKVRSTSNVSDVGTLRLTTSPTRTGTYTDVTWYFMDRDFTASGTCNKVVYDLKLKRGWNQVLVTAKDGMLQGLVVGDAPTNATWVANLTASAGLSVGGIPSNGGFETGFDYQLTPKLLDADGELIPNPSVIWTSSDPNIFEISPTGLLTPRKIGGGNLRVTAGGKTIDLSIRIYGVQVAGGTLNATGLAAPKTTVILGYESVQYGVSSAPPTTRSYTLTGPAGWNNNQPATITYPANTELMRYWTSIDAPAVSGTYTLRPKTSSQRLTFPLTQVGSAQAVSASTVGLEFTIDAGNVIPPPANLKVLGLSTSSLQAQWEYTIPQGPSETFFQAELTDATNSTRAGKIPNLVTAFSGPVYANMTDLNLDKTHNYEFSAYVLSHHLLNADIFTSGKQFNAAQAKQSVDFKPIISSLPFRGAGAIGGMVLTISGLNFENGMTALFGSKVVDSLSVIDTQTLRIIVPPHAPGPVNITLKNNQGESETSAKSQFTYFDVTEYLVDPPSSNSTYDYFYSLAPMLNGDVWLSNQVGQKATMPISKLSNGTVSTYPSSNKTGGSPAALTRGSDGNLWFAPAIYTATAPYTISKITSDGTVVDYPVPFRVSALGSHSNGYIWFWGADVAKFGKIKTDGTGTTIYSLPTDTGSEILSMIEGPDGNMWFSDQNHTQYGRVSSSGAVTAYSLRTDPCCTDGSISRITRDASGFLYVTAGNQLLKISVDGSFKATPMILDGSMWSTAYGSPNGFAYAKDDRFWFSTGRVFHDHAPAIMTTDKAGKMMLVVPSPELSSTFIADLKTDSSGRVWYSRGNMVGVLTPQ